ARRGQLPPARATRGRHLVGGDVRRPIALAHDAGIHDQHVHPEVREPAPDEVDLLALGVQRPDEDDGAHARTPDSTAAAARCSLVYAATSIARPVWALSIAAIVSAVSWNESSMRVATAGPPSSQRTYCSASSGFSQVGPSSRASSSTVGT